MKLVRIPGFVPINWYVWHQHDGRAPWANRKNPLRWRLRLLVSHRRFAR